VTHFLVLPSPFLGSPAYAPLVAALRAGGDDASVATHAAPPVAADLVAGWSTTAERIDDAVLVLVPHSNAGHIAPLVSDRRGGLPIVFMDAALPGSSGASPLVPAGLRSRLADLADSDGLLPAWTRWWPREDLADVLPGDWFDRIDAIAPRVPLAYVDDTLDVPAGWEQGHCAYLAFGETYAEELVRVRELGWPVRVLGEARHCHFLVGPEAVAGAVRGLTVQLTQR